MLESKKRRLKGAEEKAPFVAGLSSSSLLDDRDLQNSNKKNVNKGHRFQRLCDTTQRPPVRLIKNLTSGSYQQLDDEKVDDDDDVVNNINGTRRLTWQNFELHSGVFDSVDQSGFASRTLQSDLNPDDILIGRHCFCAPVSGAFCPEGIPLCKVFLPNPYREDLKITCMAETEDRFLRYVWPLCIFLFVFFGVLCFCSPKGNYSKVYFKKLLFCWNEERYEQSLNYELDRIINRVQRRQAAARQAAAQQELQVRGNGVSQQDREVVAEEGPPATFLVEENEFVDQAVVVLKTRRYHADFGEKGNDTCSICLCDIANDDRVGDLKCGHVFHSNCLKSWIQKKNHCPLCKASEVAQVVSDDPLTTSSQRSDGSDVTV